MVPDERREAHDDAVQLRHPDGTVAQDSLRNPLCRALVGVELGQVRQRVVSRRDEQCGDLRPVRGRRRSQLYAVTVRVCHEPASHHHRVTGGFARRPALLGPAADTPRTFDGRDRCREVPAATPDVTRERCDLQQIYSSSIARTFISRRDRMDMRCGLRVGSGAPKERSCLIAEMTTDGRSVSRPRPGHRRASPSPGAPARRDRRAGRRARQSCRPRAPHAACRSRLRSPAPPRPPTSPR